eukprot:12572.XXX_393158_393286_1 [CDS] Oithona nana genome sequencing.
MSKAETTSNSSWHQDLPDFKCSPAILLFSSEIMESQLEEVKK